MERGQRMIAQAVARALVLAIGASGAAGAPQRAASAGAGPWAPPGEGVVEHLAGDACIAAADGVAGASASVLRRLDEQEQRLKDHSRVLEELRQCSSCMSGVSQRARSEAPTSSEFLHHVAGVTSAATKAAASLVGEAEHRLRRGLEESLREAARPRPSEDCGREAAASALLNEVRSELQASCDEIAASTMQAERELEAQVARLSQRLLGMPQQRAAPAASGGAAPGAGGASPQLGRPGSASLGAAALAASASGARLEADADGEGLQSPSAAGGDRSAVMLERECLRLRLENSELLSSFRSLQEDCREVKKEFRTVRDAEALVRKELRRALEPRRRGSAPAGGAG